MRAILAMDNKNGFGKNGKLPNFKKYAPNDLQQFKEYTMNKTLVMGSRTFWSLPVRPLPGRKHVVITSDPNNELFDQYRKETLFVTMGDFLKRYSSNHDWIVIGGAKILQALYPYLHEVRVTVVNADLECDVFVSEFMGRLLLWRFAVVASSETHCVGEFNRTLTF